MKSILVPSLGLALLALTGCSTVETRIGRNQAAFNSWSPEVQQIVSSGRVAVGLTADQVQVALGKPDYVFARSAQTGSFQVWSYRDRGPRFSFGVGMGSFHGRSGYSTGIGMSTASEYPDEKMRVIFDQTGRVVTIEEVRQAR